MTTLFDVKTLVVNIGPRDRDGNPQIMMGPVTGSRISSMDWIDVVRVMTQGFSSAFPNTCQCDVCKAYDSAIRDVVARLEQLRRELAKMQGEALSAAKH